LKISFEGIGIPDSLYRSDICVMNVNWKQLTRGS
jgi:hypothetical protein